MTLPAPNLPQAHGTRGIFAFKDSSMARTGNRTFAVARRLLRWIVAGLLVVLALPYAIASFYNFIDPPSTLILWRKVSGAPVGQQWQPLAKLGPHLPLAVIAAEDSRFCDHHGIDPGGIWHVLSEADSLQDVRGGSTITQQTAKNLFLWPSRSLVRKILEAPLALWLDLVLSKRRILEIYLNIAEWGPAGEFGAEAAAQRAFRRPAGALTRGEAAMLAAALPNPFQRDAGRPGPALRRLGGIYVRRMESMAGGDACLRPK
jgi:monofunctional biosynthetic peptidoglycan transglycosylase